MNEIPDRLAAVRQRIAIAAAACGRDPADIRLVAVSKTKPEAAVRAAVAAGQSDFGENYLQDALPKMSELSDCTIEWHFIGRIQGNKAADISRHFAWVHGLDRLRHAELLDRHRPPELAPLQVCLQVNLSGEDSKGGVGVEQVGDAVAGGRADGHGEEGQALGVGDHLAHRGGLLVVALALVDLGEPACVDLGNDRARLGGLAEISVSH